MYNSLVICTCVYLCIDNTYTPMYNIHYGYTCTFCTCTCSLCMYMTLMYTCMYMYMYMYVVQRICAYKCLPLHLVYIHMQGFTAELGASGSFCPRHITFPVTAAFFNLSDSGTSPYLVCHPTVHVYASVC